MKYVISILITIISLNLVLAQDVNIPDPVFLQALIDDGRDMNGDGIIQTSEAEEIYNINFIDLDISSLEGVKSFVNIFDIIIHNAPNLTEVDLSGMENLGFIDLSNNAIETINLDDCPNLHDVILTDNQLSEFLLSSTSEIHDLNLENNQIINLELTNQSTLFSALLDNNPLENIDLSGCSALDDFRFTQSSLRTINLDGCLALHSFELNNSQVESLTLPPFSQINMLYLSGNDQLKYLDFSHLTELNILTLQGNSFEFINATDCQNLFDFYCTSGSLSELILDGCYMLGSINLDNTQIEVLNLNGMTMLYDLSLSNNINLHSIYLKNGVEDTELITTGFVDFSTNPNMNLFCVDGIDIQAWTDYFNDPNLLVNSFCPDGNSNTPYSVEGNIIFDADGNGCDENDETLAYQKLNVNNGLANVNAYSNSTGTYIVPVFVGDVSIELDLDNSSFFNVDPLNFSTSISGNDPVVFNDFCITPIGDHIAQSIEFIPIDEARPGFNASYKIIYTNEGNQMLNGNVLLNFRGELMTFESASVNPDALTDDQIIWSYSDMAPFESRFIIIDFLLNSPMDDPPLNGDDILDFLATCTSESSSGSSTFNNVALRQVVVNSFDPNDKTCLQGDKLYPEMIGDYLHYLIRFENTGTANAINIRVEDIIDTTVYEISTLEPTDASHTHRTQIEDGNVVHFIFDDINLPFDDENNDGYVAFKIKTKDDLELGDNIDNYASIFFDFNFPIITNVASTVVTEPTSVKQIITDQNIIEVFPNPFTEVINVSSEKAIQRVEVFLSDGTRIYSKPIDNLNTVRLYDLEMLSGYGLIKIYTQDGIFLASIITTK